MMLLPLIKKDILIIKSYFLVILVIPAGLPLLIAYRQPQMGGIFGFLMAVLLSSVEFNLAIGEKENKYPKATALLASTPYMKHTMVSAKYIIYITIYLVCCLTFFAEMQYLPVLAVHDFARTAAVVFLIQAVGVGVLLPVQYKLGYEKTKFAFVVIIMASPVLTAALMKMDGINFDALLMAPPIFVYGGMILAGVIFLAISACLSVKFYDEADLA